MYTQLSIMCSILTYFTPKGNNTVNIEHKYANILVFYTKHLKYLCIVES